MVCNGIIQNFIVNVNPALFGYEKDCLLTVKHSYKKTITSEGEELTQGQTPKGGVGSSSQ